ncbi:MAG: hypothetical protein QXX77_04180, partial [Candidatus Methanosuratincola sp.]
KGVALMRKGLVEESIPFLDMALKIEPRFARAAQNLALALEKLGRKEESEKYRSLAESLKSSRG